MQFRGEKCLEDIERLTSQGNDVVGKLQKLGDAGILQKSEKCHHLPDFYCRKLTRKIAMLYAIEKGEPIIARIGDSTVMFRIMTNRLPM